jgi:hypothetical protein
VKRCSAGADTSAPEKTYRQESLKTWIDDVQALHWTYDPKEQHLRLGLSGKLRLVAAALLSSSRLPTERLVDSYQTKDYNTLHLVGTCPRCGHEMDKVVPRRHPDDNPRWTGEVLVYCNCATVHPSQPPGRTGCGSYGRLKVSSPPDPCSSKASTATPDDLRWELQAEEMYANRLPATRAAAQKWAAAITSITGVFAIVALVKGPSAIGELLSPWQQIVYGFVSAAIVLALLAIGLAAAAAGGTPRLSHLSGREAQQWEGWQATAAKHQLMLSRPLAYAAVLSILAAIIITWTGPT